MAVVLNGAVLMAASAVEVVVDIALVRIWTQKFWGRPFTAGSKDKSALMRPITAGLRQQPTLMLDINVGSQPKPVVTWIFTSGF